MRCKYCGTRYSLFSMRCPKCQRDNSIFRGHKDLNVNSSSYTVDLLNYILNRVLIVCVIACFMAFGFLVATILFQEGSRSLYKTFHRDQIEKVLEEYYEKEEFVQMYHYMQDQDVMYERRFEDYIDAARMSYSYNEYMNDKLQFLETDQKESHSYYLKSAIWNAQRTYTYQQGLEDLDRRSSALLKSYQKEIESFLKGTCSFSEEEMRKLLDPEADIHYSDIEEIYLPIAMERKGWSDEMD